MTSLQEELMTTLYSVWRRRWLAIAVAWVVALAGWVFVATIPNAYESTARIQVDTSSLLQTEIGAGTQMADQLEIVRLTLVSRLNLEKVLRRAELDTGLDTEEEVDEAIATLAQNISVDRQQGNLFTIGYTSADPDLSDAENANMARRVVDNLVQIFMEENVTADRDDINEAIRFFEDQLAQRERELEQAEQRRAQFEQEYLGQLPGEGNVTQRLSAARMERERLELQLAQARNSLGILQAQLSSTPSTIAGASVVMPGGQIVTGAAARVQEMEAALSAMYAQGKLDQHPDVILAKRQLERLRQQAAEERASGTPSQGAVQANPVYTDLRSRIFEKQSEVAALQASLSRLSNAISQLEQQQISEPGIAAEQAKLNRDYGVLRSQYDALLRSREEIKLQSDVQTQTQQVRFSVVDPPSQPRMPVAPNRPLLLSTVLLAALATGTAIAFLVGQIATSYVTSAQLENRLDYPVLGSVTEIVSEEERAQNRVRLLGFAVLSIGLFAIYAALMLYEAV